MSAAFEQAIWPLAAAEEALVGLARASKMPCRAAAGGVATGWSAADFGAGAAALARGLGLELEAVAAPLGEVEQLVAGAAPALLLLPGGRGLLALLGRRGGRVVALTPALGKVKILISRIAEELTAAWRQTAGPAVDELLAAAGVAESRRPRARRALLAERAGRIRLGGCFLVRLPPGSSFAAQARQARLGLHLFSFVANYGLAYGMLLGSWWLLGRGVISGRFEAGWLAGWALILLCMQPLRALGLWSKARLTVDFGALLKRRLLQGALRLEPGEMRHQGAGQHLGRVIESEAVESQILNGGFLTVVAIIELVFSGLVLAAGAAPASQLAGLLAWLGLTLWLGWRFFRRRMVWTEKRIAMTNDLVERMIGHRTRVVQEPRESWHEEEDRDLAAYHRQSVQYDRDKSWLLGLAGRGWLGLGIAALLPAFVAGGDPVSLAIGLGGVLTAYRAFLKLSEGANHLSGALVGWQQATGLFRAASREEPAGVPAAALATGSGGAAERVAPVLLEAIELGFSHPGRSRPVLDGCNLAIRRGERILLQGSSGGGKSTLAALLAGLHRPGAGLVLLGGLDLGTVGAAGWRRRVVAAPQFHENHVWTETFAFNLLLGRRWPAEPADLAEAEQVCRELGLGELLGRMPGGLHQPVGETGWQLSHGEKSRLFVARALLQGGDLLILDESFAALDPSSFEQALDCVLRRASSLLVIAHP